MKRVREHRDALLRRLPALQIAVAVAMVAVAGSYWFVQVVQGDYYRELAENNRLKEIPVEAARGLIHDRASRILVENVPSYNLLLEVSRSRDPAMSLEFAAEILGPVGERARGRSRDSPGSCPLPPDSRGRKPDPFRRGQILSLGPRTPGVRDRCESSASLQVRSYRRPCSGASRPSLGSRSQAFREPLSGRRPGGQKWCGAVV